MEPSAWSITVDGGVGSADGIAASSGFPGEMSTDSGVEIDAFSLSAKVGMIADVEARQSSPSTLRMQVLMASICASIARRACLPKS